jgi:hypothetical protein
LKIQEKYVSQNDSGAVSIISFYYGFLLIFFSAKSIIEP